MSFTVEFGWWLVPLLITLTAFGWACYVTRDSKPGAYGAGAFIDLMFFLVATIASLFAWLVWAVLV